MTDISLNPHKGKLKCRLTNNVHHWPAPNTKRDVACQMHRWAVGGKKKKKRELMLCSHCKVVLCTKYFMPFHTVSDLVGKKRNFKNEYYSLDESEHEV